MFNIRGHSHSQYAQKKIDKMFSKFKYLNRFSLSFLWLSFWLENFFLSCSIQSSMSKFDWILFFSIVKMNLSRERKSLLLFLMFYSTYFMSRLSLVQVRMESLYEEGNESIRQWTLCSLTEKSNKTLLLDLSYSIESRWEISTEVHKNTHTQEASNSLSHSHSRVAAAHHQKKKFFMRFFFI